MKSSMKDLKDLQTYIRKFTHQDNLPACHVSAMWKDTNISLQNQ